MNILICDDVKSVADKLEIMMTNRGHNVNISVFYNASDVLNFIRSGANVDACILDIVMPGINGVELAQMLRDDGYNGFIVFLSASRDYGPESYKVKAFNYLVKPVSISDIRVLLSELSEAMNTSDTASILVKTAVSAKRVQLKDISYVEVRTNYVHFKLIDNTEIKARTALIDVAPQILEDSRFVKCHRSFIVNLNDIDTLQGNEFIMHDGAVIPISRSMTDVKRLYLQQATSH